MARREVEAARAWGVPRSIFLGAPLPGPGEPLWTDEDREWAVALLEVEDGTCGGCGQPLEESRSPEHEFSYTAVPIRCHACATMTRLSRTFLADAGPTAADGLRFHVHHD